MRNPGSTRSQRQRSATGRLEGMNPYFLIALVEGCGPGLIAGLLDPQTDPTGLLRNPPPLPPAALARLRSPDLESAAARMISTAGELGFETLTPLDPSYPDRLRATPLRPNLLFAKGDLDLLGTDTPSVAVVGSRTHTAYGESATRDFAGALARAGVPIWSGLAYGVDTIAHREALRWDTPTVAVLAGGLDRVYPHQHRQLSEEIIRCGGLLLSESPPGRRAQRGHFPRRNRIIAAAARAVLVVEAGLLSGSLHTAHFASEFGVPVFAVPGVYTSPRSAGCHALIAEGAQIARSPEDLLRDLGVEAALHSPSEDGQSMACSADEEAIIKVLTFGPRPSDLVARETRLPRAQYVAALFGLLDKGRISQGAGDVLSLQSMKR